MAKLSKTKFLQILRDDMGWFSAWPTVGGKQTGFSHLRKCIMQGTRLTPVQFLFDAECIHDEGDFASVLEEIQSVTSKIIGRGKITEKWKDNTVKVSLKVGGKQRTFTHEVTSDYIPKEFFIWVNEILAEKSHGLLLIDLPTGDQSIQLCLTSSEAFLRAAEQLPELSLSSPFSYVPPGLLSESSKQGGRVVSYLDSIGFFPQDPNEAWIDYREQIKQRVDAGADVREAFMFTSMPVDTIRQLNGAAFSDQMTAWLDELLRKLIPGTTVETKITTDESSTKLELTIGGNSHAESGPQGMLISDINLRDMVNPLFYDLLMALRELSIKLCLNNHDIRFYLELVASPSSWGVVPVLSNCHTFEGNLALINHSVFLEDKAQMLELFLNDDF